MAADLMRVSESDLRECCRQALRNVGVPDEHAELAVYVMDTADLQGIETHGVRRLIPYLIRIREGLINPTPEIRVRTLAPAVRLVHGDNGLGPVVAMTGLNAAMDAAAANGIGLASCTASNHFGAGAPYALAACKRGLMLLGGSNASPRCRRLGAASRWSATTRSSSACRAGRARILSWTSRSAWWREASCGWRPNAASPSRRSGRSTRRAGPQPIR